MNNEVIYAPYIAECTATIIDGVKVFDKKKFKNFICKVRLFFMPNFRKKLAELYNKTVDEKYYKNVKSINEIINGS